ncbi:MAG: hypothetical protein WAV04_02930 [Candidatus Microsaccharimonas sp.]
MITKDVLTNLYIERGFSMKRIAIELNCSVHRVEYWMRKYMLKRRSRSEALYHHYHPDGHPFSKHRIRTIEDATLYGLGIGLYWGEGTKRNRHSVRLGNSDPALIRTFMQFLETCFGVNISELRFGLQLFTDIEPIKALLYWREALNISEDQFYKPHITVSGSLGTYRQKSLYGVITLYYNNSRLRDILVSELPQ